MDSSFSPFFLDKNHESVPFKRIRYPLHYFSESRSGTQSPKNEGRIKENPGDFLCLTSDFFFHRSRRTCYRKISRLEGLDRRCFGQTSRAILADDDDVLVL